MTSQYLNKIGYELGMSGIAYELADSSIFVPLPNNFGTLEVQEYEEGKDIVQLLDSIWATHGYLLAREYKSKSPEEAIRHFIEKIFSGELKMITATDESDGPYMAIWDLNEIRRANNEKYAYKIHSEI